MNTLQLAKMKQHLLQEIGENTAAPYDWKINSTNEDDDYKITNYGFDADVQKKDKDGNVIDDIIVPYVVVISRDMMYSSDKLIYRVSFGIRTSIDWVSFSSTSKDIDTGNWRRVMATVIDIIEKEVLTDSFALENELEEYTIEIHPSKESEEDNRRLNLYMMYIKNNMPSDASVHTSTDEDDLDVIEIVIPVKEIY
jgi:hypothetical protein